MQKSRFENQETCYNTQTIVKKQTNMYYVYVKVKNIT